jgi:diketogulonate reductase-like aldo/keto reductase
MEYREFGKTGFKVSVIGMGTWFDPFWTFVAAVFRIYRHARASIEALKIGLDAGINLIDTAEIYYTEPLVAKAIEGRKRDELFIASKVWSTHLHYDDVIKACNRSLRKLRTSYIDLYQIHFPNSRVPINETMRAMEKLVDEGKIRYIGVSNFSLTQMIEAQNALSKYELVSTQMEYNLLHRNIERDILPYCKKERIAVLAYYPLAHGKLAGSMFSSSSIYRTISLKYGGKTPAQIALNWLLSKSDIVFPIPRGSNPSHVKENLGAVGWRLDEPDIDALEKFFT